MEKISVDNSILQDKVNKLIAALRKYSDSADRGLSGQFRENAYAVRELIEHITGTLSPHPLLKIIDIINGSNSVMLDSTGTEADSGYGPMDDGYDRFVKLCDIRYVHEDAKGIEGQLVADQILHDYLDAIIMFVLVTGKKQGVFYEDTIVETLTRIGHRCIDGEADNVTSLQAHRDVKGLG